MPRLLGPYRLVRRLGAGGMAEVFLAVAFGASGFEKRVVLEVLRRSTWAIPPTSACSSAGPPELARWVREGLGQGGAEGATSGTVLEDT